MCSTCGCGETHSHSHTHSLGGTRLLKVERDLLAKNDRYAADNRRWLEKRSLLALNLVSSPGAGKTSLLVRTLEALKEEMPFVVIEGDQQTQLDVERIRACEVPALQINTGKGCHLDAHQIGHALLDLEPPEGAVVMIENVGNLVCPAGFDLGEEGKVVVLSVTEGEDKPLKYPHMFHAARLMIINKIDLLPYLDFDLERCIEYARRVNPGIEILQLSVRSGKGLTAWFDWLRASRQSKLVDLEAAAQ